MLQHRAVEVQNQPDAKASDTKISEHLSRVNSVESIDGFNLDNDSVCHNEVWTVLRQQYALVVERNT